MRYIKKNFITAWVMPDCRGDWVYLRVSSIQSIAPDTSNGKTVYGLQTGDKDSTYYVTSLKDFTQCLSV